MKGFGSLVYSHLLQSGRGGVCLLFQKCASLLRSKWDAHLGQPVPFIASEEYILAQTCFTRVESGEVVVKLKGTEIVRVSAAGDITLDSGGSKRVGAHACTLRHSCQALFVTSTSFQIEAFHGGDHLAYLPHLLTFLCSCTSERSLNSREIAWSKASMKGTSSTLTSGEVRTL